MSQHKHGSEKLAARQKLSAENAARFKAPIADFIDRTTIIFREANETIPEEDFPEIKFSRLIGDDPRTYMNFRDLGFGVLPVRRAMKSARASRYPDRPPAKRFSRVNDPELKKYRKVRSRNASELDRATKRWGKFVTVGDEGQVTYFHDVYMGDINGAIPENHSFPGGIFVLPTFENQEAGSELMRACIRAAQRISQLASSPEVEKRLKEVPTGAGVAFVARNEHLGGKHYRNALEHTSTRMQMEALITTAQVTALLLGGVKKDFDIADALESLQRNGAYKLFGLMPMGVLGPTATNGGRLQPEYALDRQALENGEFILGNELRQNIIDDHVQRRTRSLGIAGTWKVNIPGKTTFLNNTGCPAKPDHMKFSVDLLLQELDNLRKSSTNPHDAVATTGGGLHAGRI